MTRKATLCQNILNAQRIFTRISKFRCFHETKQTQNDVGRFFYNLAEFVFEYFRDSRRILATLQSFVSIRFSLHDRTVTQIPNTSSSARSTLLSLSDTGFLTQKVFTKYFPFSQLLLQNLAKTLLVLAPDMLFSCGD